VGHSHHHHGGEGGGEASERIFKLGLAADVALTAGKAVTGYLSGSTAIVADAAHSLSDIVRVWTVKMGVRNAA
jgi:divalent metal cation (Fe/Co/Zn/Cd) transporter